MQIRIKKTILWSGLIFILLISAAYSIKIIGFEELRFDGALLINSTTLSIKTNDIVRMFVNSDGNVGIGTTTPATKLDVQGSANITGTLSVGSFEMGNAGVGTMNVSGDTLLAYNSGAVGIGTKTPTEILTVMGNLSINDTTGGTSRLFVDVSTGNVGIGKTSPNFKLDVAGQINASGVHIDGDLNVTGSTYFGTQSFTNIDASGNIIGKGNLTINNSVLFVDRDSGKIGIGTASPLVKLDVIGEVNVSGNFTMASGLKVFYNGSGWCFNKC